LLLLLSFLVAVVLLIINSSFVQTKIASNLAAYLSKELKTTISIERVDIDLFKTVILENVRVDDLRKDTLLYAQKISIDIADFDYKNRKVVVNNATLDNLRFDYDVELVSRNSNLQFLIDYFATSDTTDTTVSKNWDVYLKSINFNNLHFTYLNSKYAEKLYGVHYNDIETTNTFIDLENISFSSDTIFAEIRNMQLKEKSGFILNSLSANAVFSSTHLNLNNLKIETPESKIKTDLLFNYQTYKDYNEFITNVKMNYKFIDTRVQLADVAFFAPFFEGIDKVISFNGNIKGYVNNLKGRDIAIKFDDNTYYKGNFDFSGLPDIQSTFINFNAEEVTATRKELLKIPLPPFLEKKFLEVPENFEQLGVLKFKGSFTGFLNNFVTYGKLNTNLGNISSDLSFVSDTSTKSFAYDGRLLTNNFDIGKFYKIKEMGYLTSDFKITATGFSVKNIKASIDGNINKFIYNNYNYKNIEVLGDFQKDKFIGEVNSLDENFAFNFDGKVDFSNQLPVFDFKANVESINLAALNFIKSDKYSSLSTKLELNATGNKISNLQGSIKALDLVYCLEETEYDFKDITLTSEKTSTGKKLSLESEFIDVAVNGIFYPEDLANSFIRILADVFPALQPSVEKEKNKQKFDFDVNIKNTKDISALFFPKIIISPNSKIYGNYDSRNSLFSLFLRSQLLETSIAKINEIYFDAEKVSEVLYFKSKAQSVVFTDSLKLDNFTFGGQAYNDNFESDISWQNPDKNSQGDINLSGYASSPTRYQINILPSSANIRSSKWDIEKTAKILIDSTTITVFDFLMRNEMQSIALNGTVSKNPSEVLNIDIRNFDLSLLNKYNLAGNNELLGYFDCNANIKDIYNQKIIESNALVENLFYNHFIGDIDFASKWDGETKSIKLDGYLDRDELKQISFYGDYFPSKKVESLDLTIHLEELNLNALNAFVPEGLSSITGDASGNVKVKGEPESPKFSGTIDFQKARFKIDYLNTFYTYSNSVRVGDGWFGIDYKPLFDDFGNSGLIVAQVYHENFKNWNFDVLADVNKLQCLNTTVNDNSLYYGNAFATGSIQISGFTDNLDININATTEKGTSLNLPLGGSTEVSVERFVTFVNSDSLSDDLDEKLDLSGISLNLEINATPDAEVKLIFDEQIGDIMRGRGSGIINMEISQLGDFTMFGRYEIEDGDYLFTLQNIINKKFQIANGGYIGWYGDPYNADINLSAVYNVRAPLYDIMLENRENYRKRVPVELQMKLSNKLFSPDITFDVRLPNADENAKSQLKSAISSDQELNKQVFALLVLNKFLPVYGTQGSDQNSFSTGAAANSIELLSNQLSNWLSQISNDFNVGVNYRPGDNITNQELAVALSTQLFNERLLLSGNFGVSNAASNSLNQSQSGIVGDFVMEYMITEDGKLRLKVFNESNDFELTNYNQSRFTQGVGLVYREEFNTLSELLRNISGLISRKEDELEMEVEQ
jgi:TamB, inner membrane protein subunit of TAM complex